MSTLNNEQALILLGEIKADVRTLVQREETNSHRISKIEKWQWTSAGGTAVLAVIVPFLLKLEPLRRLFM